MVYTTRPGETQEIPLQLGLSGGGGVYIVTWSLFCYDVGVPKHQGRGRHPHPLHPVLFEQSDDYGASGRRGEKYGTVKFLDTPLGYTHSHTPEPKRPSEPKRMSSVLRNALSVPFSLALSLSLSLFLSHNLPTCFDLTSTSTTTCKLLRPLPRRSTFVAGFLYNLTTTQPIVDNLDPPNDSARGGTF